MRCPKCGEDRMVETVTTGTTVECFCSTCAHAWRQSEWSKAEESEKKAVARQAMTR